MPNYFFSITDGETVTHDISGTEQVDLAAARQCAEAAARSMLAQQIEAREDLSRARFEIHDAKGALVDAFPVTDALKA